ncbi:hypothetical protein BC827DRAFT_1263977 [Russula dissimulans]|nr:hypothetical protein BC827DRAFT_1263977 [Russula dissimulans]
MPLPSGVYFIRNKYFSNNFAGHWLEGREQTSKLPIIGTPDRLVWRVENLGDDLYYLTIEPFVTVAENEKVWGYTREPGVVPKKWRIQELGDSNEYNIIDPDAEIIHSYWTLPAEGTQISLETPLFPPDPRKRWLFERPLA